MSRIAFAHPYLALVATIAAAALIVWLTRRASSTRETPTAVWLSRLVCLAAAVLALAGPIVSIGASRTHRVAMIDVSAAVSDEQIIAAARAIDSPATWNDPFAPLKVLAFSNRAAWVGDPAELTSAERLAPLRAALSVPRTLDDPAGGSAIGDALQLAAADVRARERAEIRLFTTGTSTRGDADAELLRLADRQISVTAVPMTPIARDPFIVQSVDMPSAAGIGETVTANVVLVAREQTRVTIDVMSGGEPVASASNVTLRAGLPTTTSVLLPLRTAGPHAFEVHVRSADAERVATAACWIAPPRDVIVFESDPSAPATRALQQLLGTSARVQRRSLADLDDGTASAQLLVIADTGGVPLTDAQAQHLRAAADGGAGLLFAGDARSFSPSGWGIDLLADVVPLRLRSEAQITDPSAAIVFIIDTSGSMGATRLELAKEVVRLALRRLQPQDFAGIVEFYGAKRWAAPLQSASNRVEILRALNRLTSGGGTEIYPAVEEATYALRNVNARARHVVIITDGGVEAAAFEPLLRRMADAGQTVSTVAIGTDPSPLLESMAEWGRGRFYRVLGRLGIPEILVHQPQTDLPPPTVEQPRVLRAPTNTDITRGVDLSVAMLGGHVRTIARRSAEVAVATDDGDPILARWRVGRGRVAALATPLGSAWSESFAQSAASSALLSNLCRSLYATTAGGDLTIAPTVRPAGLELEINLAVVDDAAATASLDIELHQGDTLVRRATAAPVSAGRWNVLMSELGSGTYDVHARTRAGRTGNAAVTIAKPQLLTDYRPDVAFFEAAQRDAERSARRGESVQPSRGVRFVDLSGIFILLTLASFVANVYFRRRLPRTVVGSRRMLTATIGTLAVGLFGGLAPRASADVATTAPTIAAPANEVDELAAALRTATEACARPDADASDWARLSRLHDANGDADAAITASERALALQTDSARRGVLAIRLAALRIERGDAQAGWVSLTNAQHADAVDPSAAALLTLIYGRPELAGGVWTDSTSPTLRAETLRGTCLLESGDAAGARTAFASALKLAVSAGDRRFLLDRQLAASRVAGTLDVDVTALLGDPALDADRLLQLAPTLRERGRIDELLSAAARIVASDATDVADASGARARLLAEIVGAAEEAGRVGEAEAICRERWRAAPADDVAVAALVGVLVRHDRVDEADHVIAESATRRDAPQRLSLARIAAASGRQDAAIAVVGATDLAAAPVDALLFAAAIERERGNPPRSASFLSAALARARDDATSLRAVADAYEQAGETSAAIAAYRQIAEPSDEVRQRIAWLLSQSGALPDAQQIWSSLARSGSAARRRDARARLLDCASRTGTIGDIAADLEQRLAEGHADADDIAILIDVNVGIRDFVSAAAVLRAGVQQVGGESAMLQQLAELYLQAQQFGLADRTLRQLLERDPAHARDTLQQIAVLAIERNRPDDARGALEAAARLTSPDDETSTAQLNAGIYAQIGLYEDAAREYRRALSATPERSENWLLWADAMKRTGRQAVAVRQLLLVAAAQDSSDDVFAVAIDGLLNLDAPRDALRVARRMAIERLCADGTRLFRYDLVRELSEAVGDRPFSARVGAAALLVAGEQRTDLLRELINLSIAAGQLDRVVGFQRTLLALGHEVPPQVFLDIGRRLLTDGRAEDAARAFRRAIEVADDNAPARQVADIYERAGRLAQALEALEPLARRAPQRVDLNYRIGQLHEQLGNHDAAAEHYLAAIAALIRQGKLAPGLEPAMSFDAGPSRSIEDAERYLDALIRGTIAVTRTPDAEARVITFVRVSIDPQLAGEPGDESVPTALANVATLGRRLLFALHRADVADELDLSIARHYPSDDAYRRLVISERAAAGLSRRGDTIAVALGIAPGNAGATTQSSDVSMDPDAAANVLPRQLIAGDVDAAQRTLAAIHVATPADGETYQTLIAAALALDQPAAANVWSAAWFADAMRRVDGAPDASAIEQCVRASWPALDEAGRRAMVTALRATASRAAGESRARLALLFVQASIAVGDEADARTSFALDAAALRDLQPNAFAQLVTAVPRADQARVIDAASRSLSAERRRPLLLQWAMANDASIDEAALAMIRELLPAAVSKEGAAPDFGFTPPGRIASQPAVWLAIGAAAVDDPTIARADMLLAARAFALGGEVQSADAWAIRAIDECLGSTDKLDVPSLKAAVAQLSLGGAEVRLNSIDADASKTPRAAFLGSLIARRLGKFDDADERLRGAMLLKPDTVEIRNELVAQLRSDLRWRDLVAVFEPFKDDAAVVDDSVRSNLAAARREAAAVVDGGATVFALYANAANAPASASRSDAELRRFRAFHQLLRDQRQFVVYPARVPARAGGLRDYDVMVATRPSIYEALSREPWAAAEYVAILRSTPSGAADASGTIAGLAAIPGGVPAFITTELDQAAERDSLTTNDRRLLIAAIRSGYRPTPALVRDLQHQLSIVAPNDVDQLRALDEALRASSPGDANDARQRWIDAMAAVTGGPIVRPRDPSTAAIAPTPTAVALRANAIAAPGASPDDGIESARIAWLAQQDVSHARVALDDDVRRGLIAAQTHPRTFMVAAGLRLRDGDVAGARAAFAAALDGGLGRSYNRVPDLTEAIIGDDGATVTSTVAAALEVVRERAALAPSDGPDLVRASCLLGRWAALHDRPADAEACLAVAQAIVPALGEHQLWIADLARAMNRDAVADAVEYAMFRANRLPSVRVDALIASLQTTDRTAASEARLLQTSRAGTTQPATMPTR